MDFFVWGVVFGVLFVCLLVCHCKGLFKLTAERHIKSNADIDLPAAQSRFLTAQEKESQAEILAVLDSWQTLHLTFLSVLKSMEGMYGILADLQGCNRLQ